MAIDPRLHRIVAAQPYPLLFATISGAHLYGFPSPDSDFDLRGAHVLPLDAVVGLDVRDETVQQSMIVPPHDESEGRARHSVRAEHGIQSGGAQGPDAPYEFQTPASVISYARPQQSGLPTGVCDARVT
jgi:RNA repair pathway DNA polymerase beta family